MTHKFHACCHGLHAVLEALGGLDLPGDQLDRATIRTHPRWLSVCAIAAPATGLEAKFSYRLSAKGHKLIFVPNAVVYHQHPETLGKYLRTKFWRGYWRMQVYKRYTDKAVHDKYTTLSLKLQVMAALVWYVLAVAFVLWPFLGYGLAACILYMLITSLASTGRNYSSDQKASLFIPPLYVLRALSIAAGIIFWSGHNVLKKKKKMGTVFHAREMHK